jgi:hypothetical protein
MTRQEQNRKILKMLEGYVETYPDMRFQQILYAFGVTESMFDSKTRESVIEDLYHEESDVTLERMREVQTNMIEDEEESSAMWEDYSSGY